MHTDKLILGVDVGTQSTKALLYNCEAKEVIATGTSPHDIIQRADGTSEQKATWWIDALRNAIRALPAPLVKNIAAIGVSGQQHGFVPLNHSGDVLTTVKLWNDTSATRECSEIEARFGGRQKMIEQVGNPMLPGYTAPKIAWLKKHRPDIYAQLATVLLPHDYINFRLTGVLAMEYGDASGTGLLNIRTRTWDADILSALDTSRDLSQCLPPLISGPVMGRVSDAGAATFGVPARIPVSTGGGDNMMTAIGTGCVHDNMVSVSMGTSGTIFACSDHPVVDDQGEVAAFCNSHGSWLPLICTMNCTVATELVRDLLLMDVKQFNALAASVPPGADGLITVPFFTGERTPNLPDARGSLIGLTPGNFTGAHMARSAMESALWGLRYGLDAIRRHGVQPNTIHLTGGGSKSPLWRQMAADILGCTICLPAVDEAAAFGAALQALWALEAPSGATIDSVTETHVKLRPEKLIPNKDIQYMYNSIYDTYLNAVHTLTPLSR